MAILLKTDYNNLIETSNDYGCRLYYIELCSLKRLKWLSIINIKMVISIQKFVYNHLVKNKIKEANCENQYAALSFPFLSF